MRPAYDYRQHKPDSKVQVIRDIGQITKSHKQPTKYRVSHTKIPRKLSRIQIRKDYFDILKYMKLLFSVPPLSPLAPPRLEIGRVAPRCLDFWSGTGKSYVLLPPDGAVVRREPDAPKNLNLRFLAHLGILEFLLT